MSYMIKAEKMMYSNMETIGYWYDFGGLCVKKILYGINDEAVVVANKWNPEKHESEFTDVHKCRIQSTISGRSYIKIWGKRFYFDECMRMG